VADWNQYCSRWASIPEALKKLGAARFWVHPTILAIFNGRPQLPRQGRWHAEKPTSNVCAERAFGIMRNMEAPTRFALHADTLRAELMTKANGWLVDRIVQRAAAALR